jgi:hypothetical protein
MAAWEYTTTVTHARLGADGWELATVFPDLNLHARRMVT